MVEFILRLGPQPITIMDPGKAALLFYLLLPSFFLISHSHSPPPTGKSFNAFNMYPQICRYLCQT